MGNASELVLSPSSELFSNHADDGECNDSLHEATTHSNTSFYSENMKSKTLTIVRGAAMVRVVFSCVSCPE